MHRRNFFVGAALLALVSMSIVSPLSTSALSIAEIQAQIQVLLGQIAGLSGQPTSVQGSASVAANPMGVRHRVCSALYRNLSLGMRGDDVMSLQEFLRSEGYLSANATGYFGPLTVQALARWQASQGISAVGAVGPVSRARIVAWCGGGGIGWSGRGMLDASPSSGPAPLAVNFTFTPSTDEGGQYYIEFGDGGAQVMSTQQIYCLSGQGIRAPCISPSVASHTYVAGGTYVASVSRYIACLYTNPRCMIAQPPPLSQVTIVVVGPVLQNLPPSISSFSGPTTLSVNQTGTWSISASDPENGPLSYQIWWGDENVYAPIPSAGVREFIQTTTFTHAYAYAGTYTVTITVRDSSGQEAKTTATVQVGSSYPVACTADARQCPDGSWVGRSGPNCQFICPGGYTFN